MPKRDSTILDFVSLFNVFWYRDFPLSESYKILGSRAEWATHIGMTVRSCAELLGFFTYFETGTRTDAVIKDNRGRDIAHIEWEWGEPFSAQVNEIKKLYAQRKNTKFSVFLSYSRLDQHQENLDAIVQQWKKSGDPLLVFLVTFDLKDRKRWFYRLETHLFKNGRRKMIRSQPALPWDAEGTRWESRMKAEG